MPSFWTFAIGDSDSYSNANIDSDQNYGIKKEKENSEDGMKAFDLCSNAHNFSGNYFHCFINRLRAT